MSTEDADSPPEWIADLVGPGARVRSVVTAGSSRETVLVEVPSGASTSHGVTLVARRDPGGGPLAGTTLTPGREAAACGAARAAGIPAPAVAAVADDASAYAMELLPGQPGEGTAALDDYLATLGRLHATGTTSVPAAEVGFDPGGAGAARLWREVRGRVRRPAPLLETAFGLVDDRAGSTDLVTFCHGDAGPGNYLHSGRRVTGLVDWEMASCGDPHDDLASVAVRLALHGIRHDDYPGRLAAAYTPVSGIEVDPHRYLASVVRVLARMVAASLAALDNPTPGVDRSVQAMGLPLMEVHLVRSIAALGGQGLPEAGPVPPDLAYAAELASVIGDDLAADAAPVASDRRRRLRYLAHQLTGSLTEAAQGERDSGDGDTLTAAWRSALSRLAVLPAARPVAEVPIAGIPHAGVSPC